MSRSIQKHLVDLYVKLESPIHVILYFIIAVGVIYVSQIPDKYKYYGNNTILRIIFFVLIVGTCKYISYIHSLLLALFVVLYISFTPGMKEAFEDLRIINKLPYDFYLTEYLLYKYKYIFRRFHKSNQ